MEVHRGTKIHDPKKGEKETKIRPQWRRPINAVPLEPRSIPRPVHVTSLAECSMRYGANKNTSILLGTVIEVEIGPKATALGRRRNFVVARFGLVGGSMKVATINIRIVKLHTSSFYWW